MKYNVTVNKKFSYVKSYRILKSVNQNTNKLSRMLQSFVDKYIEKKQDV